MGLILYLAYLMLGVAVSFIVFYRKNESVFSYFQEKVTSTLWKVTW